MQIGQGFIANSFKPAAYVHDDTKEYRMLFKHHDGLNASCLIKPLNKSLRMRVTVLYLGTGTSRVPHPCENGREVDLAGMAICSYNTRAFFSCTLEGLWFLRISRTKAFGEVSLDQITYVNTWLLIKLVACSFIDVLLPRLR